MKYCRNCGKELNSDIQYCPNCGASVSEEQSGKNENSYQESNADGSLWESLVEFFKALIEYMKEAGLHIIDAIDKIIQMPPNIPKDSIWRMFITCLKSIRRKCFADLRQILSLIVQT